MPIEPIADSKTVTGAAFDPERSVLTLRFRNGSFYEYSNVDPHKYGQFQAAESKGGWIAQNLAGKNAKEHPFTKIPPPEEEQQ